MALTEFASTSSTTSGNSVPAKSAWITSVFAYVTANNIKMVCWFNTDKETDWAAFGGASGDGSFKYGRTTYKTYSTYKSGIAGSAYVSPTLSNPRLLTDLQFAGN